MKKNNKTEDDVKLVFQHQDCVLVGGMDKEDDKVNLEIFYDKDLDKEKINELFKPKVFHNIRKISYSKGEAEDERLDNPNNFHLEENIYKIEFETIEDDGVKKKDKIKDNLLIKGDNLLGLYSLAKRLKGSIDVIYIDPPYYFNKKKASGSLSYNSNFKLSTWLTFMKNRLEIARELLSDTGVIFISTHDLGSSHLKLLCDDVFEEENYIEQLSIENNPKGRKNSRFFSKNGEFCFVYAKKKSHTENFKEVFKKENLKKDEYGRYFTNGRRVLVGPSSNKRITDFKSKKNYIVYYNKITKEIDIYIPKYNSDRKKNIDKNIIEYISINNGNLIENTYTIEKFKELYHTNLLLFKKNTIYEKEINIKKRCKSILFDTKDFDLKTESATKILNRLNIDFKMSKSPDFIKILIKMSSGKNATVLDFFAGSGTTAHSVLSLNKEDGGNRKFILIEQMDYIENITAERIKRAMIKEGYEDSFIYMELKESDIRKLKNHIKSAKSKEELMSFVNIEDRELLNNKSLSEAIKFVIEKYIDNHLDYVSYEDLELLGDIKENEYRFNESFYEKY